MVRRSETAMSQKNDWVDEDEEWEPAVRLDGSPERRRKNGGSDERRRRTDHASDASQLSVKNSKCQFCIGREFRRSRLRGGDIPFLALFQYPVRCLKCRRRQRVDLLTAARSEPADARYFPDKKSETWEHYTSGSTARFDFEGDEENVVAIPDAVPKRRNPLRPLERGEREGIESDPYL